MWRLFLSIILVVFGIDGWTILREDSERDRSMFPLFFIVIIISMFLLSVISAKLWYGIYASTFALVITSGIIIIGWIAHYAFGWLDEDWNKYSQLEYIAYFGSLLGYLAIKNIDVGCVLLTGDS